MTFLHPAQRMSSSTTTRDEVLSTATREEAVDPDVASTSAQLMPKKGILKRTSSHSNFPREGVVEQNVSPQPQQLWSSDQFPNRPTTKIPKLTLTWSEKNAVAVYGDTSDETNTETDDAHIPAIAPFSTARQTRIQPPLPISSLYRSAMFRRDKNIEGQETVILNDDDDEEESEKKQEFNLLNGDGAPSETDEEQLAPSNMGNSHIAGKWWFGKSTKNIPHCAKWGCTHGHHGDECAADGTEYLTPTQRRSREIQHLRKQLKLAFAQLEDKDSHLNELRERLHELESLIGSTNTLSQQHRLMQRHKEFVENYEHEKQKLIDKHEIRVRQLIQEAVDARAEMMKMKVTLKQLEGAKVERKDEQTMTEGMGTVPNTPTHSEFSRGSPPILSSPQVECVAQLAVPQVSQELLLHLQAYENEAMVWRTKAAQLEIVLKEQIHKSQQVVVPELERFRIENERLRMYIQNMELNPSNRTVVESDPGTNLNSSPPATECCSQQCTESKKQLVEENNRLLEKVEEQTLRLNDCEDDLNLLRDTIRSMEDASKKNFLSMEQMSKEIEERTAEVKAANMTVVRLQGELATKTKAICYLEERHQAYRNIILDHHLVVKDETTVDWRRGFSDPRYVVSISKRVQTDLTEEALRKKEVHFINLHDKLKELEEEFSSKKSDMLERFQEIEQVLLAKTSLVDSLTHQLEEADKEAVRSFELHQKEREAFQERLFELGQIVENVPILQFEVEKLQQERSLLEYQLKNAKEEYDAGLEVALAESLKKYHEQSNYWTEKVSIMNANNESLRNENIALKHSMDELKLRTQLEKADMWKRLASSIDHVSYLKKQLNRRTRDVQVDVHPRVVSKYVACRPNAKHKMTDIEKGDLFDDVEERFKLCQGELNTTRRQVEVLQQKLFEAVETQAEYTPVKCLPKKINASTVLSNNVDTKSVVNHLKEQLKDLEKRNCDLTAQMARMEAEKHKLINNQQGQIARIVSEFHVVRKEFDKELGVYQNEKQRLKARIAMLEKIKEERDELLNRLKNAPIFIEPFTATQQCASRNSPVADGKESSEHSGYDCETHETDLKNRLKRCLSVPHLLKSTASCVDEIAGLRERNSLLARSNARLNSELLNVKHSIELSMRRPLHMSYGGAVSSREYSPRLEQVSDLQQVHEDLQNIIIQTDNSVNNTEVRNSSTPSLRLAEKNLLTSTTTEIEHLKRSLRKSEEERQVLSEQLDRLTLDFQDACRELDLYKHEPREDALRYLRDIRRPRSRSLTEIGCITVDVEEHLRWKEKAGAMFRELNRIRKEYGSCDDERRELRIQLVMLRGELAMAQSQLAEMSAQRRKQCASVPNVKETTLRTSPTLSERKRIKLRLRCKRSEEFRDPWDSSSGTFVTACTSLDSLDDIYFSTSEPELVAIRFEGARKYRTPKRSRHTYRSLARSRELGKLSVHDDEIRRSLLEHDEIIKEAAKMQIASLRREIAHLQKHMNDMKIKKDGDEMEQELGKLHQINESLKDELRSTKVELDSWRLYSESRFASYEEEDTRCKQKLHNLDEELEKLRKEQLKLTKEGSAKQSAYEARISMLCRENEMFVKKIDEMEKERQKMYLVMFKKGKEAVEHDVKEMDSIDQMTEDRIVLRFLHDAFYYYLLNKGDSREHLQAMMTLLNFSSQQKEDVYRKRGCSH